MVSPLHYSMTTNFWIYLSCLLCCAAIGHRIWDYEQQKANCYPLAQVLGEYQSSLRNTYWNKIEHLKDNIKRKRNFSKYRDSLVIINYFLDSNETDKLMEMCISKDINKDELVCAADLPIRVQKYRYANLLLEYFCNITQSKELKSTVEIESKVIDYDEVETLEFEIEFDFYSLLQDDVDLIYTIDGKYIPDKLGGGVTKSMPKEIDILIKDKVTGERKNYEFNNLKV